MSHKSLFLGLWGLWDAGGLVVAGGVEDEFAEEFAGGGAADPMPMW